MNVTGLPTTLVGFLNSNSGMNVTGPPTTLVGFKAHSMRWSADLVLLSGIRTCG